VRIIAGKWKGRRLKPPRDSTVRPTADRVKEAWMSIVHLELADARVLDLFAGAGALGLEALSRGAREAHFVEIAPRSLATLGANLDLVEAGDHAIVHRVDALKYVAKLRRDEFDVAFADPPYAMGLADAVARAWLEVPFARVIGIEHEKAVALPEPGDRRVYGDTVITLYRSAPTE
jgi:16S rRNA (guanine966-N2)-methyltransferase